MGYRRNREYVLVFEDKEFEGLEVKTRGMSTAGLMDVLDVVELLDRPKMSAQEVKQLDKLFRIFAGCPVICTSCQERECPTPRLKSWNLEDENGPVPATYEGLMAQDVVFAQALLMAWVDAVVGTPGPLDETSKDGGRSVEVSIPMATLSSVPPN